MSPRSTVPRGRAGGQVTWLAGLALGAVAIPSAVGDWRLVFGPQFRGELGDTAVYVGAITEAARTGQLYDWVGAGGLGFTYPPFAALLLTPITWVSHLTLARAWTLLSLAAVIALAVVLAWAARPRASRAARFAYAAGSAAVLLASLPVQSNLVAGQVSIFLILAVTCDLVLLARSRALGGLSGLAGAVKITPLVVLPHLALTRQWRALATALGVFTVAGALGALAFPRDSWDYWTRLLFRVERVGDPAVTGNQSILGVLARAGLDGTARTLVWVVLVVVVAVVGLLRARTAHRAGDPLWAVIILGVLSVVVTPVSWPFHQIWLVLAGLALVLRGPVRSILAGVLVLVPHLLLTPMLALTAGSPVATALVTEWVAASALLLCLLPEGALMDRSREEPNSSTESPERATHRHSPGRRKSRTGPN